MQIRPRRMGSDDNFTAVGKPQFRPRDLKPLWGLSTAFYILGFVIEPIIEKPACLILGYFQRVFQSTERVSRHRLNLRKNPALVKGILLTIFGAAGDINMTDLSQVTEQSVLILFHLNQVKDEQFVQKVLDSCTTAIHLEHRRLFEEAQAIL